jgi:hypothetical protein
VHLDITKAFHSPTDALLLILENSKIYIKTYIKIAPTCFGLRPSSEGLHLLKCKLPDDGRRPKHVAAILIQALM